jgi:hypothetical protein
MKSRREIREETTGFLFAVSAKIEPDGKVGERNGHTMGYSV